MNEKTEILAREKESFLPYLAMESPIWQAKINAWHAEKKRVIRENY